MNDKFLLLVVAIAIAHAYTVDLRDNTVDLRDVQGNLQRLNPALMMLEQLLNLEDKNECIEKMFCFMEEEKSVNPNSSLSYIPRVLTNEFEEIDEMAFEEIKDLLTYYPLVSRVVDAIYFGRKSLSSGSCSKKYNDCSKNANDFVDIVRILENEAANDNFLDKHTLVKRSEICTVSGVGCGLIGFACVICAAFSFGTCGAACAPAGAIACSAAGIGCSVA